MARKKQQEIKVEDAKIILDQPQELVIEQKQESVEPNIKEFKIINPEIKEENKNEIPINSVYRNFVKRFLPNDFYNLGNNVIGPLKIKNDEELAKMEPNTLNYVHGFKYLQKSADKTKTLKLIYDSLMVGGYCILVDENMDYNSIIDDSMSMKRVYCGNAYKTFYLSTGYGFWRENKNLSILMFIKLK